MKHVTSFLFALFLSVLLICPAFASAGEGETSSDGTESSGGTSVSVDDGTTVVVPDVVVENEVIVEYPEEETFTYVGTSVYALSPVGSSDTSGLKAVLLNLLGEYDAIVVEHEYESSNGYTNYVREIQPDYVWIFACSLLIVVVFCLFRLGGSILCKQ